MAHSKSIAAMVAAGILGLGVAAPATAAGGGGGGADLQVSGSASPGSPSPAFPFSITYRIKNSGPDAAPNVVFTSTIPYGSGFNYAVKTIVGQNYLCEGQGINVSCNLGTMLKGVEYAVTVNLNAPPNAGAYAETGVATSDAADAAPGNNASTANFTVKTTLGACPGQLAAPTQVAQILGITTVVSPAGQSFIDDLIVSIGGVTYYVFANFTDAAQPVTQVINLDCKTTTPAFIAGFVNVTGTPAGTVNFNGRELPAINGTVIQVFQHKDVLI